MPPAALRPTINLGSFLKILFRCLARLDEQLLSRVEDRSLATHLFSGFVLLGFQLRVICEELSSGKGDTGFDTVLDCVSRFLSLGFATLDHMT